MTVTVDQVAAIVMVWSVVILIANAVNTSSLQSEIRELKAMIQKQEKYHV